jgi:hypothetical protein
MPSLALKNSSLHSAEALALLVPRGGSERNSIQLVNTKKQKFWTFNRALHGRIKSLQPLLRGLHVRRKRVPQIRGAVSGNVKISQGRNAKSPISAVGRSMG